MTFGERMRQIRKARGITIPQIKEKTGISNGNLSMIETDKVEPKLNTIKDICEYLQISADYLIWGDGKARNQPIDERYHLLSTDEKEIIEMILKRAEKRAKKEERAEPVHDPEMN